MAVQRITNIPKNNKLIINVKETVNTSFHNSYFESNGLFCSQEVYLVFEKKLVYKYFIYQQSDYSVFHFITCLRIKFLYQRTNVYDS